MSLPLLMTVAPWTRHVTTRNSIATRTTTVTAACCFLPMTPMFQYCTMPTRTNKPRMATVDDVSITKHTHYYWYYYIMLLLLVLVLMIFQGCVLDCCWYVVHIHHIQRDSGRTEPVSGVNNKTVSGARCLRGSLSK